MSGIINESLENLQRAFRDELIDRGLLIPMGVDGLYGRGAVYERVVDAVEAVIQEKAHEIHGDQVTRLRFPPIYSREVFERTDYVGSFPQLMGAVSTFTGRDADHRALMADRDAGRSWDGHLGPADVMLVPAACHPCYATLPSELPQAGEVMDIYGYCFRHEPAVDPARMQSFRMHEFVMVGTEEQAKSHLDVWRDASRDVLLNLGLDVTPVLANDQFFGRGGRMLANNQREDNAKTEWVAELYGDSAPGTAIASLNRADDHFGHLFDLRTPNGDVAHSACVAFGVDRITLASLRHHGLDLEMWPAQLRTRLGL